VSRPTHIALLIASILSCVSGLVLIAFGLRAGWAIALVGGLVVLLSMALVWPKQFTISGRWPNLLREDMRSVEELLRDFPGPVEIRQSRRKVALKFADYSYYPGLVSGSSSIISRVRASATSCFGSALS
jgi:hypothetical protein